MARYANDPRWIRARFPGTCARCAAPIPKGSEAYWYPLTRDLYCDKETCGRREAREFAAAAADEDRYTSWAELEVESFHGDGGW